MTVNGVMSIDVRDYGHMVSLIDHAGHRYAVARLSISDHALYLLGVHHNC